MTSRRLLCSQRVRVNVPGTRNVQLSGSVWLMCGVFQKTGALPGPHGAAPGGVGLTQYFINLHSATKHTPSPSPSTLLLGPLTTFGKANSALPAGSWGATCLFTPISCPPSCQCGGQEDRGTLSKKQTKIIQIRSKVMLVDSEDIKDPQLYLCIKP